MTDFTLASLEQIIADRAAASAADSYTKSLLVSGIARVAKKFGEEAIEAVIAAVESGKPTVVAEAADVMYHLLVLLRAREIALDDVLAELEKRTAKSGHAEKASRTS